MLVGLHNARVSAANAPTERVRASERYRNSPRCQLQAVVRLDLNKIFVRLHDVKSVTLDKLS